MDSPSIAEQTERPYVSMGHLSEPETVRTLVSAAHRRETCDMSRYRHGPLQTWAADLGRYAEN